MNSWWAFVRVAANKMGDLDLFRFLFFGSVNANLSECSYQNKYCQISGRLTCSLSKNSSDSNYCKSGKHLE